MIAAVFGFAGAVLGAVTALISAALGDRRHTRAEHLQWCRDQRTAVYAGAIRYLLRAAYRRSEISPNGSALNSPEHQREWFDDLVEVQYWMRTLGSRCGEAQKATVDATADKLHWAIHGVLTGAAFSSTNTIWDILRDAEYKVSECARLDAVPARGPSTSEPGAVSQT
jgi:hypothetical protein